MNCRTITTKPITSPATASPSRSFAFSPTIFSNRSLPLRLQSKRRHNGGGFTGSIERLHQGAEIQSKRSTLRGFGDDAASPLKRSTARFREASNGGRRSGFWAGQERRAVDPATTWH